MTSNNALCSLGFADKDGQATADHKVPITDKDFQIREIAVRANQYVGNEKCTVVIVRDGNPSNPIFVTDDAGFGDRKALNVNVRSADLIRVSWSDCLSGTQVQTVIYGDVV